ncbi:hypothetical protein J6590_015375 [Homalodisca vitripennis]|nr:hypothetical protein J6590_015375 [Homalodisca vitripennis]
MLSMVFRDEIESSAYSSISKVFDCVRRKTLIQLETFGIRGLLHRCGKLRKLICSNKATVENLKQFAERLEEKPIKSSVDDLPNILPAIFNYAFHKDTSFRQSALPAFIKLTNLLDLNKHLKEQQWWSQLKEQMIQKVDILMELITSGDENWSNLWCTTITMLGSDLKGELVLLNKLLKVVEKAFKLASGGEVYDSGPVMYYSRKKS